MVVFLYPVSLSKIVIDTSELLSETNPLRSYFAAYALSDTTSPKKAPERSITTANKAIREFRCSVIFFTPVRYYLTRGPPDKKSIYKGLLNQKNSLLSSIKRQL